MTSLDKNISGKIPLHADIDFMGLVTPSKSEDAVVDEKISFYCKDCKEFVDAKKRGKKLSFSCEKCKGQRVAFGTKKSLESFYSVKK